MSIFDDESEVIQKNTLFSIEFDEGVEDKGNIKNVIYEVGEVLLDESEWFGNAELWATIHVTSKNRNYYDYDRSHLERRLETLSEEEKDEITNRAKEIQILGECCVSTKHLPTVKLYYNAIKRCAANYRCEFDDVLRMTLIHELMHVFFRMEPSAKYNIPEIEEPLAEFGMLVSLREYFAKQTDIEVINKIVKDKKDCYPICYYGFGSYLFNCWKTDSSLIDLVMNYGKNNNKFDMNYLMTVFSSGYCVNEEEFLSYLKQNIYK